MTWTDGADITETAFTITDANGNVVASGEDGILSQGSFGVNDDSCVTSGCTDETATNYNPDANAEDGSCEYDCATWLDTEALYTCYYYVWVNPIYTVEEATRYGYDCTCVEEPVYGCMDLAACNYDENATLDQGCDYISCSCDGTTIIVDGGSFQGEVSWNITDCDGNLLVSGGAPYSCLLYTSQSPRD